MVDINVIIKEAFIHVFKTYNDYYFFDVNKNEIVGISEDFYKILVNSEISGSDQKFDEFVLQMYKNGYMQSKILKTIRHPGNDDLGDYLNRDINFLILQLSQACNLRCSYCPYSQKSGVNRSHDNKIMSWETAKKGIDFLHKHSVDSDSIAISFYGGEPFSNFKVMHKIVQYCNEKFPYKTKSFTVITNGTLITEEICRFLHDNKFVVTISLDGDKEINDRNRKFEANEISVFDKIMSTIKMIEHKFPSMIDKIGINMVMDPSISFENYASLIKKYPILKKIRIRSTIIEDSQNDIKNLYSDSFVGKFNYNVFLSYLHFIRKFDLSEELLILRRMLDTNELDLKELSTYSDLLESNAPGGQCIPGHHRIMLDVNGRFLPCEKVSELVDDYIIGDLDNGIDTEKVRSIINYADENIDECRKCFAFRNCTSCIREHQFGLIEDKEIKNQKCELIRRRFHKRLVLHALMKEINENKNLIVT